MFRGGGRGRGRGGFGFGSSQRSCKEEPYVLFPVSFFFLISI